MYWNTPLLPDIDRIISQSSQKMDWTETAQSDTAISYQDDWLDSAVFPDHSSDWVPWGENTQQDGANPPCFDSDMQDLDRAISCAIADNTMYDNGHTGDAYDISAWEKLIDGSENQCVTTSVAYDPMNWTETQPSYPNAMMPPFMNFTAETYTQAQLNIVHLESMVQESRRPKLRGARRQFTDAQLAPLRNWLASHIDNPYPSKAEKKSLIVESGLKESQINAWFMRARKAIQGNYLLDQNATETQRDRTFDLHLQPLPTRPCVSSLRSWFQVIYKRYQKPLLVFLPSSSLRGQMCPDLRRSRSSNDMLGKSYPYDQSYVSANKSRSLDLDIFRLTDISNQDQTVSSLVQSSRAATWSLRSSIEAHLRHEPSERNLQQDKGKPAPKSLINLRYSAEKSMLQERMGRWLDGLPKEIQMFTSELVLDEGGRNLTEDPSESPVSRDMTTEEYDWHETGVLQSERRPFSDDASASDVGSWELETCISCANSPLHPDFLKLNHKKSCCISEQHKLTYYALMIHEAVLFCEQGFLSHEETVNRCRNLSKCWQTRDHLDQADAILDQIIYNQYENTSYPNRLPNLHLTNSIRQSCGRKSWTEDRVEKMPKQSIHQEVRSGSRSSKVNRTSYEQSSPHDYARSSRTDGCSNAGSSAGSVASWNSGASRSSRKGRRIVTQRPQPYLSVDHSSRGSKSYQCTFCTQSTLR